MNNMNNINNINNINGKWYCYILKNDYEPHKNITYNGSTNNLIRRIKQHNCIISGGAKLTKKYGNNNWKIYVILTGFFDYVNCLQCEWRIKHPDNKRKRSKKYIGPVGRIIGLIEVLKTQKWTKSSIINNNELLIDVWVDESYKYLFNDVILNKNININFMNASFFEI
jgi:predicted GIY-YIG superfamily endonuclease